MIDQWEKGAKYWDKAWNPVIGCEKVSEGCANCYAEAMCKRFPTLNGYEFRPNVKFGVKPPKTGVVFVGNMTDIFGEWNNEKQIKTWLNFLSERAMNLILTKRADRIFELSVFLNNCADHILTGVTAENQRRLDERLGYLFNLRRRWLSMEPLLGSMNFREAMALNNDIGDDFTNVVDWVVVGAESGPNRRPCKIEWVESVVGQCLHYKIPVFVKQLDFNGKLVTDINKFPEHLQIRQVPWMERAGR